MCTRAWVYWTSIANLFARQKYEQKRNRRRKIENIVIEMTVAAAMVVTAMAALRALLIEILSFDVIYDVFISKSSEAPLNFFSSFLSFSRCAVCYAVHAFWQRHQLLIVIILKHHWQFSMFDFLLLIIFLFCKVSSCRFNFYRSHHS